MANSIDINWQIETTSEYVRLFWPGEREVISSAVLNGGLGKALGALNLKVDKDATANEAPEETLQKYITHKQWCNNSNSSNNNNYIGMMTAASLNSLRRHKALLNEGWVEVIVTCGLGNARRVGDKADWQETLTQAPPAGTINLWVIHSNYFTKIALVEMLSLVTEAKCAALQELGIKSPISGEVITGTGTDAIAIINGEKNNLTSLKYCGKHTLAGEVIGRLVVAAVKDAAQWDANA